MPLLEFALIAVSATFIFAMGYLAGTKDLFKRQQSDELSMLI
jgi:hypothetical protein